MMPASSRNGVPLVRADEDRRQPCTEQVIIRSVEHLDKLVHLLRILGQAVHCESQGRSCCLIARLQANASHIQDLLSVTMC